MNENKGPRKRLLALDTSTAVLGVAVTEDGKLLHEINASGERNHSVHLLPIIEQDLQASGTDASMLSGVAVGVGPGSYTGTRIAVTAAKTLAWAWKVPVAGISSLHALAWGGYAAVQKKRAEADGLDCSAARCTPWTSLHSAIRLGRSPVSAASRTGCHPPDG
jgi:tRNA threonylcarbamoyladenosine biosynthesis protein TsaB